MKAMKIFSNRSTTSMREHIQQLMDIKKNLVSAIDTSVYIYEQAKILDRTILILALDYLDESEYLEIEDRLIADYQGMSSKPRD